MGLELICEFYEAVKGMTDASTPLFFKPANHQQESMINSTDRHLLPRIFSHELFEGQDFYSPAPRKGEGTP